MNWIWTRSRNQWPRVCRTTLAISGRLTARHWSLYANLVTASSAKSGRDCGTTRRLLPSKRSNLVFITHALRFILSSSVSLSLSLSLVFSLFFFFFFLLNCDFGLVSTIELCNFEHSKEEKSNRQKTKFSN